MKRRSVVRLLGWGIPTLIVAALILFPVFVHEGVPLLSTQCRRNLSKLGVATEMYMSEHDYRFPPVRSWNDALRKPLRQIEGAYGDIDGYFMCPSAPDESEPSYAMNRGLDGLSERDVADSPDTVCYFESIAGRNLHGGPELFPPESRHEMGYAVCYADGHVGFVKKSETGKLNWGPAKQPRPATE